MRHIRFIISILLMSVLVPIIVLAEPASTVIVPAVDAVVDATNTAGWTKIGWEVLSVVLGIISAVAISVITALVSKHLGVKISADQQNMLRGLAHQAVTYAEQKAKTGKIQTTDRSQVAVKFMLDSVKGSSLPNLAADKLEGLIEAELGLINLGKANGAAKN